MIDDYDLLIKELQVNMYNLLGMQIHDLLHG